MPKISETITLLRKAFGAYTLQIVGIVLLTVVSSASEGIGISAAVPAFSFVSGEGGAAPDFVTAIIQKFFTFFHLSYSFRGLLLFIAALFVIRTVMLFLVQIITMRVATGYERDVRRKLFTATLEASWPYLSKQKMGTLSQLVLHNTNLSSQFFSYFSILAIIVTKTIAYVLVAFNVSAPVALFAIVAGVVAFVAFQPILKRSRGFSYQAEQVGRTVSHFLNQHITGIKTLKAMAVEEPVKKESDGYFERMRHLTFSIFAIRGLLQMCVALGGLVFVGLAFVVMYRSPAFQIATFGVIVYAINQIFTQVQLAQAQMNNLGTIIPYLTSVIGHTEEAATNRESLRAGHASAPSGDIAFERVSFSYSTRGTILSEFSTVFKEGSMTGIIGPSGAGKTTVADLLLRLYVPTSGKVTMGGVDIQSVSLKAWRSEIGYVAQDMFLLNDTIEKNITFYSEMSHEEVTTAAKLANIHDFIVSLPEGYNTVVGDRGILLSGGQRQRVVIARTLARKPRLLIFDEATSHLDTESEQAIQRTIEELKGLITTVVIAHRLSIVANADKIVVVDQGGVLEEGAPLELLKDEQSYFARAYRQGELRT